MSGKSRRSFLRQSLGGVSLLAATNLQASELASFRDVPSDPTAGQSIVFEEPFSTIDPQRWNGGPKATTGPSGFYGRAAFAPLSGAEGFNPYQIVRDRAATDGNALQISAKYIGKKMNVENYYGNDLKEFQWISGNLQAARSNGKVDLGWRRGYFEARILFPAHPLTWPAFWLLNGQGILNQSRSIEIDVVEQKGWEHHLYGTYFHEWGQPEDHNEGAGVATTIDITGQYCRYGVLVEDDRCIPYFERKPTIDTLSGRINVWQIERAAEMDRTSDVFWPLLTLALRTDVPFPDLTEEQKLTSMRVDYFRVYS